MGNSFKRKKGTAQVVPQQSPVYVFSQPQQPVQYNPAIVQRQPQVTFQGGLPYSSPFITSQTTYENDIFLSSLTGWSIQDIERLRQEFLNYANLYGVIDRDGFRKLYIASLLNTTWQGVELNTEAAFRSFDVNQTGALDFNEYIMACLRMIRGV
ncbi:unnamed protein product [Rotaria sp. Silwood2]|nr:unnamed protein product [Rotaria sp. Silwood2]